MEKEEAAAVRWSRGTEGAARARGELAAVASGTRKASRYLRLRAASPSLFYLSVVRPKSPTASCTAVESHGSLVGASDVPRRIRAGACLSSLFFFSLLITLWASEKISDFGTVALSFVCDKYYPIMD